jgi:hypothetical protein
MKSRGIDIVREVMTMTYVLVLVVMVAPIAGTAAVFVEA